MRFGSSIVYFIILMFIFIFMQNSKLFALPQKRIAIIGITANNLNKSYANIVRDILEVELYKTGKFEIIEREKIGIILKEQQIQTNDFNDTGKAALVGKLLKVDTVVIGSINKLNKYTINIKFVNVNKLGHVEYADTESVLKETQVEKAIKKLAGRAARNAISFPAGYYMRGFIPGWGQIYSNNAAKGYIFLSSFIVSGLVLGYTFYDFKKKRNEYEDLNSWDRPAEFEDKYDASERAKKKLNIAMVVFSLVYIANWVDILFFNTYTIDENLSFKTSYDKENYFFINYYTSRVYPEHKVFEIKYGIRF